MLCHVIHRHNTKNHCYCAECRRGASVAGDGSANTVRRRRRIGSLVFCLGYLLRHVMGRELSHPDLRLHHRLLQRQVVESLCSVLAQDRRCAVINYVWRVGSWLTFSINNMLPESHDRNESVIPKNVYSDYFVWFLVKGQNILERVIWTAQIFEIWKV